MRTLDDFSHYTGEWYENNSGEWIRQGFGVQTWPDGSVYEGYFFNNLRHGKGRLVYSSLDVYNGDWHEDIPNGEG